MIGLVYGVGHNNLVQCARIDAVDSVTAQYAVRNQRVHRICAFLL